MKKFQEFITEKRRMYKDGDATGKPINKEPGSEYSRHFSSGRSVQSKSSPNKLRHNEYRGVKKPQPGSSSIDRKWEGGDGKRMDNEVTRNAKFKRDMIRQQGRHMKWDNDRRKPEPGKKRPAKWWKEYPETRNYEAVKEWWSECTVQIINLPRAEVRN